MTYEKRPITKTFTVPRYWKEWAFSKDFSREKVLILCDEFKEYYSKTSLELSDIAWERRFKSWVKNQKKPLYHSVPHALPAAPQEEPKPRNSYIGFQYLAQMKMMLNS